MSIRQMSTFPRRALVLTVLLAVLMLWGVVQVAQAQPWVGPPPPGTERWVSYYSDPWRSQLVGSEYWACDGNYWRMDPVTEYYVVSDAPCS